MLITAFKMYMKSKCIFRT